MSRERIVFLARAATVLAIVPLLVLGYSAGPDPGKTGAPGEQTCAQATCHVGTGNPTAGGIDLVPPITTYSPGVKQRITIRINLTGGNVRGYGFQASTRIAANDNQAGSFSTIDSTTQILCQDGSVRTGGLSSCPSTTPVEYIEHTLPKSTNTFTFDWTPPAAAEGDIILYVAGNAANLNGQQTGDQIFTQSFKFSPAASSSTPPPSVRTQNPAIQSYSGKAVVSPGNWLEIYGTGLSATTRDWTIADFSDNVAPTSLEGVKVNVDGKPAFIRSVSDTLLIVQVPDGINTGPIDVEVVNASGAAKTTVPAAKTSPALLTTPAFNVGGKQYLTALFPDLTTFVGPPGLIDGLPFRAAKPGDTLVVYAVGCGATTPASPAGQFFSDARPLASAYQFRFGQTVAPAQGFLAAQSIGLCQFNVTVPTLGAGDVAVELTVDGVATGQSLLTTIQP